ncbi:NACHT domain-containing protein [Nostoc sp. CALU 546]|uniref:NACHT domain-containing protein n=1 Tax=Nostoc sp. CALU 546 TaxID=1867241 RepID=UPI003B682AD0
MDSKKVLEDADNALFNKSGKYLTDLQKKILQESLEGKKYKQIDGYDEQHIKNEGARLWKLLSEVFDEKVNKSNFRAALKRYQMRNNQTISTHNIEKEIDVIEKDIDILVQEVRDKIRPYIQERCGAMRVLDMPHSIGLNDIFTDVNILETLPRNRRLSINEILENFDPDSDDFARRGLGKVKEKGVPGLDVVKRYPRLMVLGKPGAGKTTFLKYLAIQCIGNDFMTNRVPIFITLKDFAEADNQPDLLTFLNQIFAYYDVTTNQIKELLKNGRFLILLDGLDEVREGDSQRVLKQVEDFNNQFYYSKQFKSDQASYLKSRKNRLDKLKQKHNKERENLETELRKIAVQENLKTIDLLEEEKKRRKKQEDNEKEDWQYFHLDYPNILEDVDQGLQFLTNKNPDKFYINQFIITCRIAAQLYTFQGFTDVEIADFNDRQIKTFAYKWFERRNPSKKKKFIDKLKTFNKIKELASSPLLLTLLCLVFEDSTDFPSNRSELYKEGIYILLKKWDAQRSIERVQIYQNLSPSRKEDLLSYVAFKTFERGDYFFKQKEVEQYIIEYIRKLNLEFNTKNNLDSEAVLKSIEAQHGLLLERAKGIYSFSHLTFHEYFTARKIITTSNPESLEISLKNLANHITEKRWREVILLAVGMLSDAARLLLLVRDSVNRLIEGDKDKQEISRFMMLINEKYNFQENCYYKSGLKTLSYALNHDPNSSKILRLSDKHWELLRQYYDANVLLIECLNSDCCVSPEVRQEIENTLFLPIVEIERRKQGKTTRL